jgi:hypothetical protein
MTQLEHGQPIKDLLLDAAYMKTANGMADYIGVTFVTIYHWIRRYFDCNFAEFKRIYICRKRGEHCYLLNIERSSYSRHDYVLKKIRSRRHCACINALDSDLIMTNAPVQIVAQILRGGPKIAKVSDNVFALVPTPVYFDDPRTPVYFDLAFPDTRKRRRKMESSRPAPTKAAAPKTRPPVEREVLCPPSEKRISFSDKVLVTLHKLGDAAPIDLLREHLRDKNGKVPRKNNTRREVYKNGELVEFDPEDKQKMRLTEKGKEHARSLVASL